MEITLKQAAAVVVAGLLTAAACGDDNKDTASDTTETTTTTEATAEPVIAIDDGGNYAPELDPADFVATIDNPYMPWKPGMRWVYDGTDDDETEHIEVVVLDEHKDILGISATVVRDTVSDADGVVVEDTYDWYAQDKDGNVWYLGEDSTEYENGQPTGTKGSWEAGVDGAYAGIVMPAHPTEGHAYRQEYYKGEAEDLGEILQVGAGPETVAAGTYDDLVVTRDWNPLEPDVVEEKTYAPGVGMVLEVKTVGGTGRTELTTGP
jgi:hypothetical protein